MTAPQDTELRTWLIQRVAEYLGLPAHEIDTARQLADYGLESVYALALCGDIEDHLDLRVEETVVWDHPTIDQLGTHLEQLRAPRPALEAG